MEGERGETERGRKRIAIVVNNLFLPRFQELPVDKFI